MDEDKVEKWKEVLHDSYRAAGVGISVGLYFKLAKSENPFVHAALELARHKKETAAEVFADTLLALSVHYDAVMKEVIDLQAGNFQPAIIVLPKEESGGANKKCVSCGDWTMGHESGSGCCFECDRPGEIK